MRIQVIARNMGLVLLVNALFMVIAVIVSALYGFDTGFSPLLLSAIITATIGSFPYIFVKKQETSLHGKDTLLLSFHGEFPAFLGCCPTCFGEGSFP